MSKHIDTFEQYALVRRSLSLHINTLIKGMPLGHRQLTIMRWLNRKGQMSLKTLALYTYTDPGTITRSVAQMIRQGLVEKVQNPKDGREWFVRISKKGQKQMPAVEKVFQQLADLFVGALNEKEEAQFRKLLNKVGTHLEKTFSEEK